MRVEVTYDGEHLIIKAVDLTGDAWDDYLHYLEQARSSQASNDLHGTNRALRDALGHLIAHLEGVVTGLYNKLRDTRSDFRPRIRLDGRHCTLRDQIADLRKHARQQMKNPLPYLPLRLKALRDILVHPTITKIDPDKGASDQIKLSELDLFDLTLSSLTADGNRISQWLDRLCGIYGYTRLHDTYKVIEDVKAKVKELGVELAGPEPRRI